MVHPQNGDRIPLRRLFRFVLLLVWIHLQKYIDGSMVGQGSDTTIDMGVSKNSGTPWFIMEIPTKMDDFGGTPIFGNPHMNVSIPDSSHFFGFYSIY